jgi:hypothetical protein
MVEQYSRFDLTKDIYAMLYVCSFFIWRFLLKNPNNFCVFETLQNELDKLAQWEQQWACNSTLPNVYAMLYVCSFFIWRFLLKNPNNFCVFDAILFMCAFQVMLDEMVTPRYFAVSTDSRVCTLKNRKAK